MDKYLFSAMEKQGMLLGLILLTRLVELFMSQFFYSFFSSFAIVLYDQFQEVQQPFCD
jgi:hypothetical protein